MYLSSFYDFENWSGTSSRWIQADATIGVYSPENRITTMSFQVLSFDRNRTLEVYLGDELVAQFSVPPHFIDATIHIRLAKGENIVRFHVPEGCEKPSDKLELTNPDSRCLSVALRKLIAI